MGLRRKYTFRFDGRKIVFIKKSGETEDHVLGKAVLFALFHRLYPNLTVEVPVEGRYKPDVVALGREGGPVFWGESGMMSIRKMRELLKKHPHTRFAFLKHTRNIDSFIREYRRAAGAGTLANRRAPAELIGRPPDLSPYILPDGTITITREDCVITEL